MDLQFIYMETLSKNEKRETGNSRNRDGEVDLEVICLKMIAKILRQDKMARRKGRQRAEADFRPLDDLIRHQHQGILQPWIVA